MKVGDIVEKFKGYLPDDRIGIVVGFSPGRRTQDNRRVLVYTADGIENRWIQKFVRVISVNEVKDE